MKSVHEAACAAERTARARLLERVEARLGLFDGRAVLQLLLEGKLQIPEG